MFKSKTGLGRAVCLLVAITAMASCSCRTRHTGEGNIPVAEAGSILKDVHFAFDSYEVDAAGKEVLKRNAEWLQAHQEVRVEVEGHADERGTNEYNMALGERRARSAADYLRSLGVSGERLSTVSYGEELPLDPRHNEEAWAKNRRAHFSIRD